MSSKKSDSHSLDRFGLLSAAATATCWSLSGVFVRVCGPCNPILLTAARLWLALGFTILISPLIRKRLEGLFKTFKKSEAWGHAVLLAFYYVVSVCAFRFAPVGEVGLVIASSPVFVLLGRFFLTRSIRPREALGVAVAFMGVAVVLLTRPVAAGKIWPHSGRGLLLAMTAALLSAVFSAVGRALQKRGRAAPALHLSVQTEIAGGILFLAPVLWGERFSPDPAVWPAVVGLGFISTMIPSITAAIASQRLRPEISTSFSLLLPVLSAIAARIVLGESLHFGFWPGTLLTLSGLGLILWQRNPSPSPVSGASG